MLLTKETVTAIHCRIVILDDLLDAARCPRNRESTIFQVVHPAQTGRFEPRRDQADIHACFNQVREFLVVILLVCELAWEFSRRDGKSSFIGWITFAENDHADVIPKKSIKKRHKNLEAFFLDDTSYHAKDRTTRRRRELHFFHQRVTTNLFSPKPSRVIMRRQETIGRWIPACVIRAMQNRGEAIGIFAQHAVETMATGRRLYFAPVMFAYRCDLIGVENSAFEKIQPSKKLYAVQSKKSLR